VFFKIISIFKAFAGKDIPMPSILLVAETGSDISPELAAQYNIHIVPMHVAFGTDPVDDGSFPAEEIRDYYLRTGKLPTTSGSTPEDFTRMFDKLHADYPDAQILYLAYSAITTCSYQSAIIASENRDYITAIDTKQVSVGQANIVCKMAEIINAHPDMEIEEAVKIANELIERANMCFTPDNLEFLRAGGRVSNVAFLGASILGLHPCIELIDGKLMATKKFRGKMKKVAPQLIKEYIENYKLDRNETLWIIYTVGLSDEIKTIAKETIAEYGFSKIEWIQAHGVITTHGGPAAFGIAGFSEKY
jgi:DegV family protein with EDD domain